MTDFCRLFVFAYCLSRRWVIPALLRVCSLSLGVRCRSFPLKRGDEQHKKMRFHKLQRYRHGSFWRCTPH